MALVNAIPPVHDARACGTCYESAADRCERDGTDLALTLLIERTLDGKYRLGRGGFGAVFEASNLRLQRQVGAKVTMGSLFGDSIALRRFEREARGPPHGSTTATSHASKTTAPSAPAARI